MSELVSKLAMTPERAKLCKGLLDHRRALRSLGIVSAIQWIDGSFCENIEVTRGRPPADIDVVTLLARPATHKNDSAWGALVSANLQVFNSVQTKAAFGCEAFFVDLSLSGDLVISQITYWFGLFTHQRVTHLWKGLLQIPLVSDDDAANLQLASILPSP
jgi:hypothetical protein